MSGEMARSIISIAGELKTAEISLNEIDGGFRTLDFAPFRYERIPVSKPFLNSRAAATASKIARPSPSG